MNVQQITELFDGAIRHLDMAELAALEIIDNPKDADRNITLAITIQRLLLRAKGDLRKAATADAETVDAAMDHLKHVAHMGATRE